MPIYRNFLVDLSEVFVIRMHTEREILIDMPVYFLYYFSSIWIRDKHYFVLEYPTFRHLGRFRRRAFADAVHRSVMAPVILALPP